MYTLKDNKGFIFNHTMLRIKEPQRSLAFYGDILGMTLVRKVDFEENKFTLYFLAHLQNNEQLPSDDEQLKFWVANRSGILELTHNWGSENNKDFNYHDGNSNPQGFGHICISVADLDAAVNYFDNHHVVFQKRPEQGTMPDIAFIKDPDGYWVEIIAYNKH